MRRLLKKSKSGRRLNAAAVGREAVAEATAMPRAILANVLRIYLRCRSSATSTLLISPEHPFSQLILNVHVPPAVRSLS
jgi:hypothetical protein